MVFKKIGTLYSQGHFHFRGDYWRWIQLIRFDLFLVWDLYDFFLDTQRPNTNPSKPKAGLHVDGSVGSVSNATT